MECYFAVGFDSPNLTSLIECDSFTHRRLSFLGESALLSLSLMWFAISDFIPQPSKASLYNHLRIFFLVDANGTGYKCHPRSLWELLSIHCIEGRLICVSEAVF